MALRDHISLTASTAASVTITALDDLTSDYEGIYETETHKIFRRITRFTVINHSSEDTLYYRFDGTVPTVTGDDTWALPPSSARAHDALQRETVQVVLISSGTPTVSVEGES